MQKKDVINALVEKNRAEIEAWKETHGTVKAVCFPTKKNGLQAFIIGCPTSPVIDAYKAYDHRGDTKKIDNLLINSCVLAGDKTVIDQDINLKNSTLKSIVNLLEDYQAEEKEL